MLLKSGKACQRQAIRPAMFGFEKDVPLPFCGLPLISAYAVPTPTETIFGFTFPLTVGPQLEKPAILPLMSIAPTAITLSPSAGQAIYFRSVPALPELPA